MNERPWLKIQPDARYDLGSVDVRFDVPLGISFEFMEVLASPTIKKAIGQFEKLGDGHGHRWTFVERIPIVYDVATMHSSLLDRFDVKLGNAQAMSHRNAAIQGDTITMVAKLWFIRPLVAVNLDEEAEYQASLGYSEGFVPLKDMPEGSLDYDRSPVG